MYNLNCWSVMGLQANPDSPFDGRETRRTNPQRPAPIPDTKQTGGAALQTGMPVFRPAPPAKVVVAHQRSDLAKSHDLRPVFVKQVVRRFHAASLISGALISISGLSQTGPAGCQFRALPDQRSGFFGRAFA
jgi:hypothetical protein